MRAPRPSPRTASGLGLALLATLALAAGPARAVPPFTLQTVEGGPGQYVGEFSSLKLDRQGRPHIAYYDGLLGRLRYAHHDGSDWHLETADPTLDDTGQFASIALDSLGQPHIAYYDATVRKLFYTRKVGPNWVREQADTASFDCGWYPSLAFDRHGRPWIASYDRGHGHPRLNMRQPSGSWTAEFVDTTTDLDGYYISLALEGVDTPIPHVTYYDLTLGALVYARRPKDQWVIEIADSSSDDIGLYSSLQLDRFGRAHVAYMDITHGALRYAVRDRATGKWVRETVDSSPDFIGYDCSLALDPTGWPNISYHDGDLSQLGYARRDAAGWHTQIVDDSPGVVGLYTSIDCDSTGQVAISYWDGTAFTLKYARGPSNVLTDVTPATGARAGFVIAPNPVRAGRELRFSSRDAAIASFELFDPAGRRVARLDAAPGGATSWTPAPASVPVGILFARALDREGRTLATRRVVFLR